MANDITGINTNRAQVNSGQSGAVKSQNQAKINTDNDESNSTSPGDRVSLTSTASRLKDIEQELANASPVDGDKVAAVKSAITNGEYEVDADRIADKMLSFEDNMKS